MKKSCEETKHYEDEFILACLFARKMDCERASTLLKNNWEWRCENNLSTLPSINEVDFSMLGAQHIIPGARSKGGNLVMYSIVANFDPSKLVVDQMLRWAAWYYIRGQFYEGMDAARNGIIMVQDLEGIGWKHFDLKFQKRFSAIFQEKFPMRMKKAMQLNAPAIMKIIVALARPFISKKLMDRMGVATKEEMIDFIGKENLWDKFDGQLVSEKTDWISAIAEYNDFRYGDKLTKPIIVDGKEIEIKYTRREKKKKSKKKKSKKDEKDTDKKEDKDDGKITDEKKEKKEKKEKSEKTVKSERKHREKKDKDTSHDNLEKREDL
jgi:hypothetical protein